MRQPRLSWLFGGLLSLCLVAGGCRGRDSRSPDDQGKAQIWAARLRAHLEQHPEDQRAQRDLALLQWMHLGEPEQGLAVLEPLASGEDSVAAMALLIAADARLRPEAVRRWSWRILEQVGNASSDVHRAALAEIAAQKLGEHHGALPDDDADFVRRFDATALKQLPAEARQALLSLRASIARRLGDPYEDYYRRQGCVQSWRVGTLQGTVGSLDLKGAVATDFVADPTAPVVPLSCVVRLWNPTPRAGVRRMQSDLVVDKKTLRLDLAAENPTRWYLDGTLIHRTDLVTRYPPREVVVALEVEPGVHRLEAVTSIPEENAWVLVRATDGYGRQTTVREVSGAAAPARVADIRRLTAPWATDAGPVNGPLQGPLRSYLAVEDALADGDSDRAERLVASLRPTLSFAEGQWLVARVEREDPTRGSSASGVRERRYLARALQANPALDAARLRSLEATWARGQQAEVRRRLLALPPDSLRQVQGELLRWRIYAADGNEARAEQALARAEAKHPAHCELLLAKRNVAERRDDVRALQDVMDALARCAGSLKLRALYAAERGQNDESRAIWEQVLRRTPDDVESMEALAALDTLAGAWPQALARHEAILTRNPFRVASRLARADLLRAAGQNDASRAQLEAAVALLPHSTALRRISETVGIADDLNEWRIDGLQAIEQYRRRAPEYDGVSEALVLDRSVARVYPNRGVRVLVHTIVHLLAKDSLDRFGEVQAPAGAELLTLRSIKPDGTRVEPEAIAGKDGLSMRDLEVGDMIEYEYVLDRDPVASLPGYVDVTNFRFRATDVPYHRSELVVVHPTDLELQEERRNDPPPALVERRGDLTVRTWVVNESARLGVEPNHRALLDEVPNVHLHTQLDVEQWLRTVAEQLRFGQRSNPALRALVRKLVSDEGSELRRAKTLRAWVVKNIEDTADLSATATATLAARQGNRTVLLLAMLREAGIRAELWLVRNRFGPRVLPGGDPLIESYDTPMLAVWPNGRKQPLMVTPSADIVPMGYVAPAFAGAPALRVALLPQQSAGPVQVPPVPASLADQRAYRLQIELDRTGNGTARGTLELRGMEAVAWRQALHDIDRDRIEEVFQEAELGRVLPAAALTDLAIEGETQLDEPLVLRFSARFRGLGVRQGGALVVPAVPWSFNGAAPYTTLPSRVTGLLIPYASEQLATIAVTFTDGAIRSLPPDEAVRGSRARFRRTVQGEIGGNRVIVRLRSSVVPGIVEPGDYPELVASSARIESMEQAVIRVQ